MNRTAPLLVASIVCFAAAAPAEVSQQRPSASEPQHGPQAPLITAIGLSCSGSGHSDVAGRNHAITNSTGHPIPTGTFINWVASDGGKGALTVMSTLAPGASLDVHQAGQTNGYTCTASFLPGPPDLVVRSVAWTGPQTATIELENIAPWTDAGASSAAIKSYRCLASEQAVVVIPVPALKKNGGTTTVTATLAHAGADYLSATANSAFSIAETNYANNITKSADFTANKSCAPQ